MRLVKVCVWALGIFLCAGALAQEQAGPAAPAPSSSTPAPAASAPSQASPAQEAPAAGVPSPAANPSSPATPAQAPATPDATTAPAAPGTPAAPTAPAVIVLPSGTKLPLVLQNAITTRNAHPGDPVYFETLFPIVQDDKIVIPAGSYVQGEITDAKRAPKMKGTAELRMRLETMILPNGYTIHFDATPNNAGTGGNESVDKEGTMHGDTDKTDKAGTVIVDTAAGGLGGAAIGAATGSGKAFPIGAGVGAAVGLATIMMTRGPDLELPRGSTVDVVFNRPLSLDASKITFTDPGKAPDLAGPPNREPVRQRNPVPF